MGTHVRLVRLDWATGVSRLRVLATGRLSAVQRVAGQESLENVNLEVGGGLLKRGTSIVVSSAVDARTAFGVELNHQCLEDRWLQQLIEFGSHLEPNIYRIHIVCKNTA